MNITQGKEEPINSSIWFVVSMIFLGLLNKLHRRRKLELSEARSLSPSSCHTHGSHVVLSIHLVSYQHFIYLSHLIVYYDGIIWRKLLVDMLERVISLLQYWILSATKGKHVKASLQASPMICKPLHGLTSSIKLEDRSRVWLKNKLK